jgi:hypothetical protein
MQSSTTSRLLLLVVVPMAACCLAVGACTATTAGGVAGYRGRPRPPSTSSLVDYYSLAASTRVNDYPAGGDGSGSGRDLAGGASAAEQDYGFVDPTPDTGRRGGTAPIPHN